MANVGLTLLLIQQWSLLLPELPDSTGLWVGLPFALAGLWYQALKGLAVIYLLAFAQLEALSALPNPREIVARDHALVRVEGQIVSVIRDQGEFLSYQLKVKRAADPALVGHQLIIADPHVEHLKTLKSAVSLDATVQLRSLAGHVNIHPRHDQMSTFYPGVTGHALMTMMHPVVQGRRMVSPLPIRQKFSDWINKEVKDPRARSVIKALTVGRNDFLSSGDQWLLWKTATAHLLVISGLHMTLVGWGSFWGLRYFGFSYSIWVFLQYKPDGWERGRNFLRVARNGRRLCDSLWAHAWFFDGRGAVSVSSVWLGNFLVNLRLNTIGFSPDQWSDRFLVLLWLRRKLADAGADSR